MIALAIILAIIAFFAAILTIRIRLTVELKDELFLYVGVLGIRYQVYPRKQKKYRLRNYTKKKIAKRDRAAALKAQKRAERRSKKGSPDKFSLKNLDLKNQLESLPPIPHMIKLLLNIVKILFSGLFKKFHFHIERLRIKVGGEDAAKIALTYVAITNGLHPVLAFVDKYSNLHGASRKNIEISTDYLSEEIVADVKLGFSTSIGGVLCALIRAAFHGIVGYVKIMPQDDNSQNAPTDKGNGGNVVKTKSGSIELKKPPQNAGANRA